MLCLVKRISGEVREYKELKRSLGAALLPGGGGTRDAQ